MNFFDIYFSVTRGLEIDFPFLHFWLSTPAVSVILISVVALRVRKLYNTNPKRGRK